jgi:hypothetical protein
MKSPPAKSGTPVVGFNHNLNYKGRVFHVQTEDSGVQHGHIITHIFMGGNILRSTKSSYSDQIRDLDPGEIFGAVRKLMEDQHKAMMKSLLGGDHDPEIAKRTADKVYAPGVLANGERAPGLLVGGENAAPKAAANALPPTAPAPAKPANGASGPAGHMPPVRRTPPAAAPRQPPPVMTPNIPPAKQPSGPPSRAQAPNPNAPPLDEIVLEYLLADSAVQHR